MPQLTRWTIRVAIGYLLLGLLGWIVYTLDTTQDINGSWFALRPVSIHFITVGWLTQLIFAVMFWMFPIVTRANPYGRSWLAWSGFFALNVGLLLRAVFEIGMGQGFTADDGWGLVVSAVLQWVGVCAWVGAMWSRVKRRGG